MGTYPVWPLLEPSRVRGYYAILGFWFEVYDVWLTADRSRLISGGYGDWGTASRETVWIFLVTGRI